MCQRRSNATIPLLGFGERPDGRSLAQIAKGLMETAIRLLKVVRGGMQAWSAPADVADPERQPTFEARRPGSGRLTA